MTPEEKCIQAVEKKLNAMENRSVTIKGVRNLSRADMESILVYARASERGDIGYLMPPAGEVKEVLQAFGVTKADTYSNAFMQPF